uniref:LolD lipoprotein releasing system, ATP-binding protein n=1 Tax=uncultured bacterium CSLF42 TaxID=1091574 RepID=G4WVX1_9BACT|nr:LolD lipoprotein releasing system, ATP-binding protein [uncultured bacterium CSLF42]
MIEVSHVSKDFLLGETRVHAVTDVSFAIQSGEFAAIAGPSGSGKSTLLNLIGCIELPTAGDIRIDGLNVGTLSSDDSARLRLEKMGFVFQAFNLLPVFTAYENVEYPLHLLKVSETERRQRVTTILRDVGMESFAHHKPSQLSGGQRQRVAIARALVGRPSIVLADEPTANLDQATAEEIVILLKRLHADHGVTIIFSTHDPRIIQRAERRLLLQSGRLAESAVL